MIPQKPSSPLVQPRPVGGSDLLRGLLLAATLVASGCTWVSASDLQSKQSTLDNDGDSFNAAEDCDDSDPLVNPKAEEVWYDGVDADCGGDDDYDADGDGYVPAEYGGLATLNVPGTGSLQPGDCNDADPAVHPDLADTWYDGEDTNCDGADDYDMDGDGFVPEEYVGLATSNQDGSGALPGGDCDDEEALVNPDIADAPYDGIDADCGGEEDFDGDGDGYVPDEYVGRATLYVAGSGSLPGGDCDDASETIFPGADEDRYDGIDGDCDPATAEYDVDGDGVLADSATGGSPDCDDTNADIYPDAVEVIGDGIDSDCDGGTDSFSLGGLAASSGLLEDVVWTNPADIRMTADVNTLWVSVAAEQVDITTSADTEENHESIVAFGVPASALSTGVTRIVPWHRNPTPTDNSLTPGHDVYSDGEVLFGAFGMMVDGERQLRLGGWDLDLGSRLGTGAAAPGTSTPFTDVHLTLDNSDQPWAVGCDGSTGQLQLAAATRAQLSRGQLTLSEILTETDVDPTLCDIDFLDGDTDATVTWSDGSSLSELTMTAAMAGVTPGLPSVLSALEPVDLAVAKGIDDRWIAVADADGSTYVVDGSGAADVVGISQPVSINLTAVDGTAPELVLGVADSTGGAWMAWGTPTDGFTVVGLNLPSGALATEVVTWIAPDDTNIAVAVVVDNDVLFGTVSR